MKLTAIKCPVCLVDIKLTLEFNQVDSYEYTHMCTTCSEIIKIMSSDDGLTISIVIFVR